MRFSPGIALVVLSMALAIERRFEIRVSFDATESVWALRGAGNAAMAGIVLDRDLGRALGRVLAHEIGHVLLGARDHDRTGLMRAASAPRSVRSRTARRFV